MKRSLRTIVLLLVLSLLLATGVTVLSGCTGNYDVILVTDKQNIEDDSYNQALYNAIEKYCKANNLTFCGIVPMSRETREYEKTLKRALENYNAKYVVTPSTAFAEVLTEEFVKPYAEKGKKFIFVSGVDHNADYPDYAAPAGVAYINIDEAELGYLTAYLSAKAFDKLGFYANNVAETKDGVTSYKMRESTAKYYQGFLAGAKAAGKTEVFVSVERDEKENGDQNKNIIQTNLLKKADFVFSVAGDENKSVQSKAVVEGKVAINPDTDYASDANYTASLGYVGIDFDGLMKYVLDNRDGDIYGKALVLGAEENAIKVFFSKEDVSAVAANASNAKLIDARASFAKNYEEAFNATKAYDPSADSDRINVVGVTVEG